LSIYTQFEKALIQLRRPTKPYQIKGLSHHDHSLTLWLLHLANGGNALIKQTLLLRNK